LLLGDTSGLTKASGRQKQEIKSRKDLESHLDRYSGLVLYMKEMDEVTYSKLCAVRVSLTLLFALVANSYLVSRHIFQRRVNFITPR